MLAIGATRFDVSAGSVEFAASTVASHQANEHRVRREEAERAALAEVGDLEDQQRMAADLAEHRKMRDAFGSA
jgi:hypothetical protein